MHSDLLRWQSKFAPAACSQKHVQLLACFSTVKAGKPSFVKFMCGRTWPMQDVNTPQA